VNRGTRFVLSSGMRKRGEGDTHLAFNQDEKKKGGKRRGRPEGFLFCPMKGEKFIQKGVGKKGKWRQATRNRSRKETPRIRKRTNGLKLQVREKEERPRVTRRRGGKIP